MATYKNGAMKIPFGNITIRSLQGFAAEQGVFMIVDGDRNCFIITLHPANIPVASS